MKKNTPKKLIVAISSRALFDLDKSNQVYEKEGVDDYAKYQIEHENEVLEPGVAFSLVRKLLNINKYEANLVEVILLSRNSADTGLRIFNSIQHYQMEITRAAFTSGKSPFKYIQAFGAHLFLSGNSNDVKQALKAGFAAATIFPSTPRTNAINNLERKSKLRIAFDGDAVLFSDEAERIYQKSGLDAFSANEKKSANQPLSGGPFKDFLAALHQLQQRFSEDQCPIRTALVTARQAPAHERVIKTLRAWNIRIDEALFLGGLDKSKFLHGFGADIFFDDQQIHCESAAKLVTTGHVPAGVVNEDEKS